MSMNLIVYAKGDIITPSGIKREFIERGPIRQTRSEDSHLIANKGLDNKDKYNLYRSKYGDPGNNFRLWMEIREAEGFEIVWEAV
jgi:hypothetical protein